MRVYIDADLYEEIRIVSEMLGMSPKEFIIQSIEQFVTKEENNEHGNDEH